MTALPYYIILLLLGIILGGIVAIWLLSPGGNRYRYQYDHLHNQPHYGFTLSGWWWWLLIGAGLLIGAQKMDWKQFKWSSERLEIPEGFPAIQKAGVADLLASKTKYPKQEPYYLLLATSKDKRFVRNLANNLKLSSSFPVQASKHKRQEKHACIVGPFENFALCQQYVEKQKIKVMILPTTALDKEWVLLP